MDFVAIDLETANANMASICQVGLAGFNNGTLVTEWKSYVNPEDFFDPINVSIHGIKETDVLNQPTLPELAEDLLARLDSQVVLSHTHFDRVAIHQALSRYGLRAPKCTWLDSARIARRTWSECSEKGYGLKNVCQLIGYNFTHHDALEDAKAAGHVMLAAIEKSGFEIRDWLVRVNQPIAGKASHAREGNSNGPLYGEIMVFTGALQIPRSQASELAAALGCQVADGVTKQTTLLVVGDQDVARLAGNDKSSKHRKAEQLIESGHALRILRETDFRELVALVQSGWGS